MPPDFISMRCTEYSKVESEDTQQQIIRETFHLVSKRDENVCNFLEGGMLIGGADNKLIYRHYATLYFVFCVDSSESELGILDLIQVFVETLDKCFENVCELDLIFHVDKVHNILAEMVMGGMVLETNMNEIVTQIDAQNKMEKSEIHSPILHWINHQWIQLQLDTLSRWLLWNGGAEKLRSRYASKPFISSNCQQLLNSYLMKTPQLKFPSGCGGCTGHPESIVLIYDAIISRRVKHIATTD
ncbi:AP-3 complex subunit sigma-1 isoform X2 [Chiloscyllium punctatum]|uniref:AP-3 complex subunit sigma-1 isoform X2 n=1 Tax=Chiloscyllium punctatum TaxID=137246 RepID=UPI003B63E2D6